MSTDNETIEAPLEVLQPSAIQALESAQIDIQIKTAKQYPRSIQKFKERGLAMVTMDEETAESCIYVRPVGKELDKKTGKWVEKFAEGPSIRCAEIVSACYCNIRIAARIIEQTERYVKCAGSCHDLETNVAGGAEVTEATVTKEGKPYSERQRALVAKATVSKAYRDAVFRIVPRALCKPLIDAAKKVIAGTDKPLAERIKRVQSWLQSKKIEDARVFEVLDIKEWAQITQEHLITLTGLKTGITDGEMQIDDAFPPVKKAPEATGVAQSQAGQTTGQKPTPEKEKAKTKEPPKEPPKEPEKAPGASTPSQDPPTGDKAAPAPSGEQATPPQGGTEPGKVETLGDPPANPPEPPAEEPLQPFQRKAGDSDEVNNIKYLAHNARLTEEQVMVWARKMGLAKDHKKLSELATNKLLDLGKAWQNKPKEFAEKIKAANA